MVERGCHAAKAGASSIGTKILSLPPRCKLVTVLIHLHPAGLLNHTYAWWGLGCKSGKIVLEEYLFLNNTYSTSKCHETALVSEHV